MAVLNIRNLPDEVHTRLRVRAAKAGRSMEAEARTIIATAVMQTEEKRPAQTLQTWVDQLYGDHKPQNVVETLLAERRQEASQEW
jgi:plasmid stability protein